MTDDQQLATDDKGELFIQENSPDGGFLQSNVWRNFQAESGRKTHVFSEENFHASIVEQRVPIVGMYFYVPRGPVIAMQQQGTGHMAQVTRFVHLARENNAAWIRIEPAMRDSVNLIKKTLARDLTRGGFYVAPYDIQPREIFLVDITKSEEELFAQMKPKTRYNVRLAEKKGVKTRVIAKSEFSSVKQASNSKCRFPESINKFFELVSETAKRNRIKPHPKKYYQTMFETIPQEQLKLYVAEYKGEMIAANAVVFFGSTATYLHGASSNKHRNLMVPYLLQWRAILDAKKRGCTRYDFGGVAMKEKKKGWEGITRFKTSFAPDVEPIVFPGSYDIVLNKKKYRLYRFLRKVRGGSRRS